MLRFVSRPRSQALLHAPRGEGGSLTKIDDLPPVQTDGLAAYGLTVPADRAGVKRIEHGQGTQQRDLARARGTEYPQPVAEVNRAAHVADQSVFRFWVTSRNFEGHRRGCDR